jgi:hypothetical protein
VAWWLDPAEEPDELGELVGDWSWSLPDDVEPLLELDVAPPLEPLAPSLELDELDELDEWPA